MTTVPQPTPASHAIAALYGTEDDTLIAWQRACAQAAETLRNAHDEERLRKALALAQDGHVTFEHGCTKVESHGIVYLVQADGACLCADALHRQVTCKHALAAQIAARALGVCVPGAAPTAPAAEEDTPAQGWKPTPKTAAKWDVHEAPASACVKFRVGTMEMTYTFRGQTDAEVLPRLRATLPAVQALLDACEARAEERRVSREAARVAAAAAPAPTAPTPTAPSAQASGPPERAALVQAALEQLHAQVQERMAGQGHANGHPASPAPRPDDQETGVCSLHQVPMERHTEPVTGDTWRSHKCEATGRFCKGVRRPRAHGQRR